ncbi:cation:proton antiporter regulatory subunit [soil metagenome]
MDVREHELPGVGKKFVLVTQENDRMTIIIHNTGAREIYHFQKGEDYPFHAVRLTDSEARQLGAILGGAYFQPPVAESMEMVLEQLSVEWLRVRPESPLAGQRILDAAVRQRTGASIIAILRDGEARPNPQPTDRVEAGDTLMVVGDREQVAHVRDMIQGSGESGA